VVELTVPERRLTFTWLSPADDVERNTADFDALIESLSVSSAAAPTGGGASAQPNDIGPIYAETDMRRFPVEPWNTASNLVFLALLVIFGQRTRLDRRRYPFLVPGLFVLAIGFIGGTVYHATRSHNIWLFLDFLPILLLTGAASIYFWLTVVKNRVVAIGLCLALLLSGRLLRVYLELPKNLGITVSYLGAALAILVPAAIHASDLGRKHRRWLLWSGVLFGVALTCRFLDKGAGVELFPMGTHFLWHIFGGLSVGALLNYIAGIEEDAAALKTSALKT
jgi:hemolysin III